MNWDDIRLFLAVARAGQILAAARRLGLNHATVGRRLDGLEKAIAAKLFERRPNGCVLTADGAAFLPAAERMEAEMLSARAALGSAEVGLTGTVRIGAPDGFGTAFLAARLGRLSEQHPGLTIQLVPVPRAFSLSRREADIAITMDRPEEGRLVAQKLVDYALGLYASSAYLDAHGRPQTLADLSGHRLVGYVDDLLSTPSLDYAAEIVGDFASRFEISSALGQTEAVAAGAGIGILHAFIAKKRAGLERVLPERELRRAYWLVYHESARGLARITAVAAAIREMVEAERASFQ